MCGVRCAKQPTHTQLIFKWHDLPALVAFFAFFGHSIELCGSFVICVSVVYIFSLLFVNFFFVLFLFSFLLTFFFFFFSTCSGIQLWIRRQNLNTSTKTYEQKVFAKRKEEEDEKQKIQTHKIWFDHKQHNLNDEIMFGISRVGFKRCEMSRVIWKEA